MKTEIFSILSPFQKQFSNKIAFSWFMVIIFGFLLRFDHYGVSSFVRWLHLPATAYPSLLHFLQADSWQLGQLMLQWVKHNLK